MSYGDIWHSNNIPARPWTNTLYVRFLMNRYERNGGTGGFFCRFEKEKHDTTVEFTFSSEFV